MGLRTISGKDVDYKFIKTIGKGGFGIVTKVERVKDGKIMACKMIHCSLHPALPQLAAREIEAWSAFESERYIAVFSRDCFWNADAQTIRLNMDYYSGGDIVQVIDTCRLQDTTIHSNGTFLGGRDCERHQSMS